MKEGQTSSKNVCSQRLCFKKRDGGFYLPFFNIAKPCPVVELFVVKDDWTAFSCDFTQAFGFARRLFYVIGEEEDGGTIMKLSQSSFCFWHFVLMFKIWLRMNFPCVPLLPFEL